MRITATYLRQPSFVFSSEPDSESSEPTKPTNEPPRNKATTPGLVGESAVAASSDRTAPGEVFSQGICCL
eukprot:m.257668 g.257668  ORF g.257668 m.257668 type:complete len:70 (+) comp54567_c0_seq56:693-902(+)